MNGPPAIDKGIPIPPPAGRKARGRRGASLPWRTMAVGDSFIFPARGDAVTTSARARTAVAHRARTDRAKFEVHTVTEDGRRVVRVWRVA